MRTLEEIEELIKKHPLIRMRMTRSTKMKKRCWQEKKIL